MTKRNLIKGPGQDIDKVHKGERRGRHEREMKKHNEGRNADKWRTKEEAEDAGQRKTVKEDRRIAGG